MAIDICFKAEDIALIYKELQNTNMTLEELSRKLKAMSGVNEVAKALDTFIDNTYNKSVMRLLKYLKVKEPELHTAIQSIKQGVDIINEIDTRIEKVSVLADKIESIYNAFNANVLNKVFNNLVKETVTVKKGMLELSYDFIPINNEFYFLNTDFILVSDKNEIIILDNVEYYYGRKFYTGSLKHNGKINLSYFKKDEAS